MSRHPVSSDETVRGCETRGPSPPSVKPDWLRDLHAGVAHHEAGRLTQAEALYRKVLKRQPNQADALNLLGVIAQEHGRLDHAVRLLTRAIRAKPAFPEALSNLARAQRAAGDPAAALHSARRAVALAPHLSEAQIQLGRCLLDHNDYAAAAQACRAAIASAPRSLDAHVNLAAALSKLKDWDAAAKVYQVAHALKPDRVETLTDFAVALRELRLFDEALQCHERVIALTPDNPDVHVAHAATLKRAQDAAGSAASCRRALALAPNRADAWIMLGSNLAALGRFLEAGAAYRQALGVEPDSAEARRGLLAAGQLGQDEAEIQRLYALADDPALADEARVSAGFALGGLYDKANEYDLAFARYDAANRLARQIAASEGMSFDLAAMQRRVDDLIAGWTPEAFAAMADWGEQSELPVFIVGMPRSGTTLTEQIAASHGKVVGGGELPELGRIAAALNARDGKFGPTVWDKKTVQREAGRYIARLRSLGGAACRVTDKMPDNVFHLGLIATLFPRARIVLCRRDPRDVGLSCFCQHFSAGLSWTHDLPDIAARAREVERIVGHWRAVLPVSIFEMSYEALVHDLEGQSRRLIDYLGLDWDPACLAFHQTDRQILTASLWQVRQPLYASSVGRWRHYRRHLTPLIEGLAGLVTPDAWGEAEVQD